MGLLSLLSSAAVLAETSLLWSYGFPKKAMSSTTTSLLAARKSTAAMNSSEVLKLANRSCAPGAMSWMISRIAVPSAPARASRSPSARKDAAITPPVVDMSLPPGSRLKVVGGRSPEPIAPARPKIPSEITPTAIPEPPTPRVARRSSKARIDSLVTRAFRVGSGA